MTPLPASDVVVIGAGPAGSVAALRLARAGARVTVLEKGTPPRDKVCGDALIPDSLTVLESLGVLDRVVGGARRARGVRVYAPNGRFVDVEGTCVCVPRDRLDASLIEAASEAGAHLLTGAEALSYVPREDAAEVRVRVAGGETSIRAALVILATGASSKALASFGLASRSTPSALALRTYFRLRPDVREDLLHIWYEAPVLPGYAWMFPVGDNVFNVGAGIFRRGSGRGPNLRDVFERFRTECPAARRMLEGGAALAPPTGAALRTNLEGSALLGDRLLAVGEAIGSTFPFSGEGIGKAMETALIAADVAIDAFRTGRFSCDALAAYPEAVTKTLRPKFRHYAVAERWLRYPSVVNLVARGVARSERLQALLSDVLNERKGPTELLSFRGVLRAALAR